MSREIKFRVWNNVDKEWKPFANFDIVEWQMHDVNPVKEYDFQQFTGLLDKHGKDIYEGDIVEGVHEDFDGIFTKSLKKKKYTGVIHWDHSCWAIGNYKLFIMNDDSLNVIGNIHENPNY